MRILVKDMAEAAGQTTEVEAAGWVHRIRDMGAISFVILRDRSGLLQLVLGEGTPKPELTLESVIRVRGLPSLNEKAPGGVELKVNSLEILSRAAPDLPYQVNGDPSKTGLEAILDNRPLSLRNPRIRSIFKVQDTIIAAFVAYLRDRDFTGIKSSKLTAGTTEGGTNLFQVDYFDRKLYLAQSPQLYKEAAVAGGLERVFEIGPVYRAEKHDTPRHINEYVSLDVEMGFIESELELIELEKGLLAHIFEELARKNAADLEAWGASVPDSGAVARAPTVSYDDALKLVNEEQVRGTGRALSAASRIFDINPEAERLLCEWSLREHGVDLVFVNAFPRRYRPFYTYPLGGEGGGGGKTMSFDAIFRGLEITSGSRRLHDYDAFIEALPKFGLNPENMTGYARILKYGCPPHGGFAIGCERLTQKILGLANVKEASLFPRDRRRVEP
ncbi:MAG: aspartate--tRNA(Asn) ligase [Treponema sp.]|jgi:nondiscriminating aspartyl-tRNA synthetase|nr:aspartate--tRNA(Asn) ligase [Treponema sp.]